MEAQHFIIVGFEADGDGEGVVDGGRPTEFLFGKLFAAALNDEFLAKFCAISEHRFLEGHGDFPVFKQASGSVDLDHRLVFEIVKFRLGGGPLSMQVIVGHIVSCIIEITAKGATRRPPPMASLGPQNDGDRTAGRAVRQHFWRGVNRGRLAGVPRLLLGLGPRRVGGCFDQIVNSQALLPLTEQRKQIGIGHGHHRTSPSASLASNHRIRFADARFKESNQSVAVLIGLGEHQRDVRKYALLVAIVVSDA